jgi:predicted dithiol-disulfide oxidoreductase (DUF899 family)
MEGLMNLPPVVSAAEAQEARDALLAKEKEATRASDALASERRRLPRVRVEKDYFLPWMSSSATATRSSIHIGRAAAASRLGSVWSFLDLTPLGRQEEWEDSPEGYPQGKPYEWWRRHDEY